MTLKSEVYYCGQVPKEAAYPEAIEDFIVVAPDSGRVAICDGASESFDSKTWARLLAQGFVRNPDLTENWLPELIAEYMSNYNLEQLPWSKQAAFDRGSFSTLLALEFFFEEGCVGILAVGDSIAVLIDDDEFVDSFPYKSAIQFQQRPNLFSTNSRHNVFLSASNFFSSHHYVWRLRTRHEPRIICMTDALAEWAFRNHENGTPVWNKLLEIKSDAELQKLVEDCRLRKEMRVDDTTLLTLVVTTE